MEQEPAKSIITYLGGAKAVSAIVDKHVSRVYRWAYSEDKREGNGGMIPAREQRVILDYCQSHKIDLRPDDFFSPDRIKKLLVREVAR